MIGIIVDCQPKRTLIEWIHSWQEIIVSGIPLGLSSVLNICCDSSDGPVLEPLLLHVVGARVKLNPLIQPPPDDAVDRRHLEWNMRLPSTQCQQSTRAHVPWSYSCNQPATFPRVSLMRIVSESFPFVFNIPAKDSHVGVTCGDLIDNMADNFSKWSSQRDYETLPAEKRKKVQETYWCHRRTADSPGPMQMLDFLCEDMMFGGVVVDDTLVKRRYGNLPPSIFALICIPPFGSLNSIP